MIVCLFDTTQQRASGWFLSTIDLAAFNWNLFERNGFNSYSCACALWVLSLQGKYLCQYIGKDISFIMLSVSRYLRYSAAPPSVIWVTGPCCIPLNSRMISVWTGKAVDGRSHGLIWCTIPTFAWSNWG